jgi:hypothetical protein
MPAIARRIVVENDFSPEINTKLESLHNLTLLG